jgi:uncharacterized protein (DUF1800 family)
VFFKERHEPGDKTIMGVTYPEGFDALKQVSDYLARHEATILHISGKLAKHFIEEEPSEAAITFIADAWRNSDGDMQAIHKAVIEAAVARPEARKFQHPEIWLYQMLRSSGANLFYGWDQVSFGIDEFMFDFVPRSPRVLLQELGESYWIRRQPNGYSDEREDWISPEHMDRRIRFAQHAFKSGQPALGAEALLERFSLGERTRALVAQGRDDLEKFVLLFASPDMVEA